MPAPLGAGNYISLLKGVATLKRLGNAALVYEDNLHKLEWDTKHHINLFADSTNPKPTPLEKHLVVKKYRGKNYRKSLTI